MDYDDNDFQNQNLQLVGEDNNRFPLSLRSFALPKFEIDDHLQVHLRFDSLNQTDALISMQGQDHSWLEEFSATQNALDFSSSPAESCTVPRLNNVWSEATSSESVEMLLKSVGEDELNQKAIAKGSDTLAMDDSTDCKMEATTHNDPSIPPDKCHDEDVRGDGQHDRSNSQEPKDDRAALNLDLSSLDEDLNSSGKDETEKQNNDGKLKLSSVDETKEHAVVDEFLKAAQNDNPLQNASMISNSSDGDCCLAKMSSKVTPNCLCNNSTQEGHLAVHMGTINSVPRVSPKKILSEQTMGSMHAIDISEISDQRSMDELNVASGVLHRDDKTNDLHFDGRVVNDGICNASNSSTLDISTEPLALLNEKKSPSLSEGTGGSKFSKNSDSLLKAITYQVKSVSNDNWNQDECVPRSEMLPFVAPVCDENTEVNSSEVSHKDVITLPNTTKISESFGHCVEENLSYNNLNPNPLSTENNSVVDAEEHRQLAALKTLGDIQEVKVHMSSKNCNELISSDMVVDLPLSTPLKQKLRMSDLDKEGIAASQKEGISACTVEHMNLKNSALVIREMSAKDYIKVINVESNAGLGPSKDASIKNSSTSTSDMGINISSSIVSKSALVSDKCALAVKSNEGSAGPERPASLDSDVPESYRNCSVVAEVGTALPAHTSSPGDDSSTGNLTSDKAVTGPAVADATLFSTNDSTVLQQLHYEVLPSHNIDVIEKHSAAVSSTPPVECSTPLNISLSAVQINNSDAQMSGQQPDVHDTAVCDASTDGNAVHAPDKKSFVSLSSGNSTGEVCLAERNSSLVTCQITEKKSEADIVPEITNDKHNPGVIIADSSNSSFEKLVPTLSRNEVEFSSLDPECGNNSNLGANCDSPTVISANEQSQAEVECQEGNKEPPGAGPDATNKSNNINFSFHETKGGIMSEDDGSFTFEVRTIEDMPQEDTAKDWKPFPDVQSFQMHQTFTVSSSANPTKSKEEVKHGTVTRMSNDDKKKQASNRKTRMIGVAKGDSKERSQSKQAKGKDRNSSSSSRKPDKSKISKAQIEATEQSPCSENGSRKSSRPSNQTSKMHDLNTSIPSAALSHQPFTDTQQMQLRAQIFVYGSLIQGVPPNEDCMISAFGGTDGGRSLWNGALHAALERYQNQSPLNNYGTPLLPRSGVLATEQMSNSSFTPTQALNSTGRTSTKVLPSVLNSSLSSSFWSMPSHDGLSTSILRGTHLEFNQSSVLPSQGRLYMSNSTPWLSQTPRPASWLFPSKNMPFDHNPRYSAVPTVGTVQVTPIRDSATPHSSYLQFNSPAALLPSQELGIVSSPLVLPTETQKNSPALVSNVIKSTAQKSRKRKKASVAEKHPVSQAQAECPTVVVAKQLPASTSCFVLSSDSPSTVISPNLIATISPTHFPAAGSSNSQQKISSLEETLMRVEQSKLQAASASAYASAAVSHSQGIWGQLAIQRQSGMISEVEEKLASAAVAAAAAASVAKAAAEAARVASEAAYRAKMIADEVLGSGVAGSSAENLETGINIGNDLAKLSPISILKGKDKMQRSASVISAACEAARKRVETASAAAKRAENLDAVMKAAELAVEAISQAGTIIAMGDPLPFSIHELIETGPECFWKAHATLGNRAETNDLHTVENIDGNHDNDVKQSNECLSSHNVCPQVSSAVGMLVNNKQANQSEVNCEGRDSGGASQAGLTVGLARDSAVGIIQDRDIQKGSLVEVSSSEDHLKGAWFSASVLDLKDGKAHVCYKDLREGQGQRKEWIPLENVGDKALRIRDAHPITVVKYKGTRKRRRETTGSYAWATGDKVDAWIHNGWWEGVVTKMSHEDESKLTVQISAKGESETVSAWNLRPSLVWQDGQWSLWTHSTERTSHDAHEGDTPCEKRQKLDRIQSKNPGMVRTHAEPPKTSNMDKPLKFEASKDIELSEKDVLFSIGSNVERESNAKVKQSRVVLGVPKPGKRRKFMEVSKHYTTDKSDKQIELNDSVKLSNYLMPQVSNAWRNPTRVDGKGRQAIMSKPRGLKTLKTRNIHAKNVVEKDSSSITTAPNIGERDLSSLSNPTSSAMENNNSAQSGTFLSVSKKVNIPILGSSLQATAGSIVSRKKPAAANENAGGKRKNLSVSDKLTSSDAKESENFGRLSSEVTEPRRSNRQIQPTSRLLEGLQSSLIMSKIPSVSHDRNIKTSDRNVSSSRGKNHG